jgi:Domain of unknown function (DUF4159)
MSMRKVFLLIGLGVCGILLAQKPFKEWPAIEYSDFPVPNDWNQKAEWTRARLRYPDIYGYPFSDLFIAGGRPFPGYWTMDYPRSDRHLLEGVRRLTRIETRSVEQVVSFGDDDMYNFPMMYAVEVGHWRLRDEDAAQLREFLLRGGFLMVDDFHGNVEWSNFIQSLSKVFPLRPVVDIPESDPIFHVLYDLNERMQAPGANHYYEDHLTYESGMGDDLNAGKVPHWRAIYDDKGRIIVAMCHNMDLGDAWEHSDEAEYPEKLASFAYRLAMNYFVYDLSH